MACLLLLSSAGQATRLPPRLPRKLPTGLSLSGAFLFKLDNCFVRLATWFCNLAIFLLSDCDTVVGAVDRDAGEEIVGAEVEVEEEEWKD